MKISKMEQDVWRIDERNNLINARVEGKANFEEFVHY